MSRRELIAQLKKLSSGQVNPREEWVQKNRAVLLSQIKNTVNTENKLTVVDNIWTALSIFIPKKVVLNVVRPIAVLLIVSLVATSGWVTTVDAAYNALPGDFLYPAKRVMEKTQVMAVSVISGKTGEAKVRTELAKRRATEAKQIAKSNDPKKEEKVKLAVNDLKNEIQLVSTTLEEIKTATNTGAADTAKDVKQNTEQIKNVLQEVKIDLLASSGTTTMKEVAEVKDLVKDINLKATEVMVTKHLEGDNSITADQVKKELSTALQTAAVDAALSQQNVETAKEVVNIAKTEVKELIANQPTAPSTSTKELSEKINIVAAETQAVATKNIEVKIETDKKIDTAANLLIAGDLTKTLDIVKEVNATTKEAEKMADEALAKVQTVLPVVSVVREVVPAPSVLPINTNTNIIVDVITNTATVTPNTTTTATTTTTTTTTTITTTTILKNVSTTAEKK